MVLHVSTPNGKLMHVTPVEAYTVICDGCGRQANDRPLGNLTFAATQAYNIGYEVLSDKTYCPACVAERKATS